MSQFDYTFESIHSTNTSVAILFFVLGLLALAVLVVLSLRKSPSTTSDQSNSKRFRPLILMGLFFVFLICSSTAFLSYWSGQKLTPIRITEQFIETPYGKVNWNKIETIKIIQDRKIAPLSTEAVGDSTEILTIIEIDGKTHAISELHYDLEAIKARIAEYNAFRKKNKKNE